MKIISVNVSLPQEVHWKGLTVHTGIFKQPVAGPVPIRELNLDGDRQADLTVHGGPHKAVYAYPSEHYAYWQRELPGVAFTWGEFGENLTTAGLSEDNLHIGDRLRIGSAILMVSQPRLPCYKLDLKFDRKFNVKDIIKRFLQSNRSGFYFSVVEPGVVESDGAPFNPAVGLSGKNEDGGPFKPGVGLSGKIKDGGPFKPGVGLSGKIKDGWPIQA